MPERLRSPPHEEEKKKISGGDRCGSAWPWLAVRIVGGVPPPETRARDAGQRLPQRRNEPWTTYYVRRASVQTGEQGGCSRRDFRSACLQAAVVSRG